MAAILVIDDVEEMAHLLREMLQGIPGVRVTGVAHNGWEARLEVSRRRPDLILLDEVLPGESSLDLLAEFQRDGIPVLLVTGIGSPTHALPEGVAGRLTKPGWRSLDGDRARFQEAILATIRKSS